MSGPTEQFPDLAALATELVRLLDGPHCGAGLCDIRCVGKPGHDGLHGSLEDELAEMAPTLRTALRAAAKRIEELETETEELEKAWDKERDIAEAAARFIESLACELGCESEWSNLHDHYLCVADAARTDRSYRASADRTIADLTRERDGARAELERGLEQEAREATAEIELVRGDERKALARVGVLTAALEKIGHELGNPDRCGVCLSPIDECARQAAACPGHIARAALAETTEKTG